jgi:DNA-binding NtrC family response regulator
MSESIYPLYPVLIVDDEISALLTIEELLHEFGITNTRKCDDSRQVENLLTSQEFSIILLDLYMPHLGGEELIPVIRQMVPDIPIIIITASNDVHTAVECMKKGVFDYVVKSKADARLQPIIHKAIEIFELKNTQKKLERKLLTPRLDHPEVFSTIITRNRKMLSIFKYIEAVSGSSETVLITGESGSGKELIAKAIHKACGRKGEYVPVDVASIDASQFSDTLFGHAPGAFTDAKGVRKGLVEIAQGGTLFIDEIADVSLDVQQKLLRFLEEREYRPLGVDHPKISNAKLVAATNKDIPKLIKSNQFRHDLYYRLNVHSIQLPPLRERKDDIPLLVDFFIKDAAEENNKSVRRFSGKAYELLTRYDYPGNIRELRSLVFDMVITGISEEEAYEHFRNKLMIDEKALMSDCTFSANSVVFPETLPTLRQLKGLLYDEAMKRVKGNKKQAARLLGISRQAISKRMSSPGAAQ